MDVAGRQHWIVEELKLDDGDGWLGLLVMTLLGVLLRAGSEWVFHRPMRIDRSLSQSLSNSPSRDWRARCNSI